MPQDIIDSLSTDSDDTVRWDAALYSKNPETLMHLAKDSNEFIRDAVARNIYTPEPTLWELTLDSDRIVRDSAEKTRIRLAADY